MICIWLTFIAVLIAIFSGIKSCKNRESTYIKIEKLAMLLSLISMLLLFYYLYTVNTSYTYVFEHSSIDLKWYYRLSALWAGQEGSMLLWASSILVMLTFVKKNNFKFGDALISLTHITSLIVVSVLLLLVVVKSPFATYYINGINLEITNWNPFISAYTPTYGQGVNPLLRNLWMAVHPPMLFFGYASFTIPFSAAIAYLIIKDEKWVEIATNWMRVSWLFLTLGIGLGGFWAYEVLGWGAWYWSWDPVETSSLVPWITATAYLHTQLKYKREANHFLAPLLAIISFILIIFSTFVTRSGMWVSVHSWQDFTLESGVIAAFIIVLILTSIFLLVRKYFEN